MDLNAYFPNDGRKLAGSDYDPSVDHLSTSFFEGAKDRTSYPAPLVSIGRKYLKETDVEVRKAWIKSEIKKIDLWRVKTGRIDDADRGNAEVAAAIEKLTVDKKLALINTLKQNKYATTDQMQVFIRTTINSTALESGAKLLDSGGFEVKFQNIKIIVKPNVLNSSEIPSGAKTKIELLGSQSYAWPGGSWDGDGKMTRITFTPTIPEVVWVIQTHYAPGVSPTARSGYGVGTRADDTGDKSKLRFHEGMHGTVFINEIKNNIAANAYPTWKGAIGQRRSVFQKHVKNYRSGLTAFKAMMAAAMKESLQQVDCPGKIVQYYKIKGKVTTVRCP